MGGCGSTEHLTERGMCVRCTFFAAQRANAVDCSRCGKSPIPEGEDYGTETHPICVDCFHKSPSKLNRSKKTVIKEFKAAQNPVPATPQGETQDKPARVKASKCINYHFY